MSTPITFPELPTFSAARKQSNLAPEPRSRTTSSVLISAKAVGLPQPRPRFASGKNDGSQLSAVSMSNFNDPIRY